jgi:Spy/CpxP family protein refolding chaperone
MIARIPSQFFAVVAATVVVAGGGSLVTAALGTVPAALAQDQAGTQPPGAQRGRMGKVLMSLNLTDAQKTQIRAIMADAHKQNESITDREQKRANMRAALAKVDTVLTPAQRTELHAKLEAMRANDANPHPQ